MLHATRIVVVVWILFLAAFRFEEKDLFAHCQLVSHCSVIASLRKQSLPNFCMSSYKITQISFGEGKASIVWWTRRQGGCCTDRIVFEHTQRLVSAWPLHGSVVARHGH